MVTCAALPSVARPSEAQQWWALSDLNGRPFGCKPNALTAELSAPIQVIVQEAATSVNAASAQLFQSTVC
jgi:hypothetical protein